jgi:pimeloyl-ACP methyl ester carboxylesterase
VAQPGSKPPGLDGRDKETNSAGSFRHHTTVPHEEDHMAVMTERSAGDTTIRPFTIDIPEAELEGLRARLAGTRFPDKETVEDDSQGVPLSVMQDLARYWATDYDWRKCEARLNAVPNFITEIDGLDIHFIHVRSKHEDALPLVVCHGWPGSVVEQLKLIGRLTDPTVHGASAADAFHVVIPSMPGYGFSGKPTTTGWDPVRIGQAYVELMKRLGYERFAAQGGDWGAIVVDVMAGGRADPAAAEPAPPELIGIHTNLGGVIPPDVFTASFVGTTAPSGLSDEERSTYEQLRAFFATHGAYGLIMATRPQTLYGLADSPIDLAAFMLDHGDGSGQPGLVQQVLEERLERPSDLTRDDILDNITLFWLTNTGVSSARLYWESKLPPISVKGVKIPVGVSTFADEIYRVPRSWAEQAYPKLVHYAQHDRGGHFAAWEQPQLLSEDVRATFRSLR